MNKAFIREADDGPHRCPQCGTVGLPVGAETLAAHLPLPVRQRIADSADFCSDPACPVVYFDDFGSVVPRDVFAGPISGKDIEAPLCPCFGLTREDVEADVAEGTVERTKAVVLKAQSPEARCQTLAPNGRSCLSAVQGYYHKCRTG
uniref:CopZ zinc binding domain-containing protein n=1 Tax=Schlesneria paludicola TaxID=360056 RepID=A0A7C2P152_9PLAN